ncbi:HxlR family transcription regulator [Halobacterium hubeiense]|jgi:DNA-binding HxlR family transcriptional regulator|uniref:HxlR family transcription regulator n=2 Tax=Halobacterium TaxID=2239 RepID=A0A0U5H0T3_9EURY|nr:helix-turn-helix domain-containing protein [Halobacterium hubeiense]CQH53401.1 HxlR family transcription regulator [Halobacterium hubeiense]
MSESEQLPAWCPGDGWCSITATASLVGKKWHPVIIHRLLTRGPLGFNALQEEVDGISSKVLSESLDDLEEKQVVSRTIVSEKPVRVEYALTELGESLEPVVTALEDWGNEHLEPVEEEAASVV